MPSLRDLYPKSSEEGLEQDFNSLDAQREACEAFIASQKHEGWTILPEMWKLAGSERRAMRIHVLT